MKIEGKIEVYGYSGLKGSIPCTRQLLFKEGGLFPGIVSFADGEILTFFRGTADHLNTKSNISMMRSLDGGETWSNPEIISAEDDDRNQAVGILGDLVVMLYASRKNVEQNWGEGNIWQVKYRISKDRGHTWSVAKDVPAPDGYTFCSSGGGCNLLDMGNGTLLGNVFGLRGNQRYTGKQPINEWVGFPMTYTPFYDSWSLLHPMIDCGSDETDFFHSPYGLGAMIRTGGFKFHSCWTRFLEPNPFSDSKQTWGIPELSFPDGLHPARITALPEKMFLATIGRRRFPYGAQAMLSYDGGIIWDWDNQFILADNCGKGEVRGDNGYASSTLLPDGTILSVWYKNISDKPYFEGTGDMYTLEMAKYNLKDVIDFTRRI